MLEGIERPSKKRKIEQKLEKQENRQADYDAFLAMEL